MSTSDILESLIEKDNGYLITSKAVESGVSKPSVSKYVREHDMEKVAHGIYILDDVWPDELFILQQRNKNIIYSGETALYLHGLIDREYSHICFTVPTDLTASTTLSASASTCAWAKPPTICPCSIPVGGSQRFACWMITEKSFFPPIPPLIYVQPGYPAAPVV